LEGNSKLKDRQGMTKKTGLTKEQLVNEFIEAATSHQNLTDDQRKEPFTWTAPEIQKKYKISRLRARGIMNELTTKGVLYPEKVWRINEWGDKSRRSGYRLTDEFLAKGIAKLEDAND
jgi:hypothetical protein